MRRRSEEFWELTYREIHACVEVYLDEREERLMLFGTGPAMQLMIATQGKQQVSWTDIFRPRQAKPVVNSLSETRERWRNAWAAAGTN